MDRDEAPLETRVHSIGAALYQRASQDKPPVFDAQGLAGRLIAQAMQDEALRVRLFQFIDALPALTTPDSIAAHFNAYLTGSAMEAGGLAGHLLQLGRHRLAAPAVRYTVRHLASQFLVAERPHALRKVFQQLRQLPAQVTVDAVGEAVLSEAEAEAYINRYLALLQMPGLWTQQPPAFSIKLSALTPHFDPLDYTGTRNRVFARLERLMPQILRHGAMLTIDMEQVEFKPMILQLFQELVDRWPEGTWLPGIALQAYLPQTRADMDMLLDWARHLGRRISIRLVKGAYWDTEVALAAQRAWQPPVFLDKTQTDQHYEELTRLLLDHAEIVYPALAGHNIRSIAQAMAYAGERQLRPQDWEVQMLYGMAEPLRAAVAASGTRLRIYVPTGDMITGIAYLIRRLLENTASTSILRQAYFEKADLATLLASPAAPRTAAPGPVAGPMPRPADIGCTPGYAPAPVTDFSQPASLQMQLEAIRAVRAGHGRILPLIIPGLPPDTRQLLPSVNPADPGEVIAQVAQADRTHMEAAVRNATAAFPAWRATPVATRIDCLLQAAAQLSARRRELAARLILEAGKNWRDADAEVTEAIDYCHYYAEEMRQLGGWLPTRSFPGEKNWRRYEPRGVTIVISPWNFPLAILAGMTTAALVAGNTVIMKPAAPTPAIAHTLHEILLAAGVPPQVCQLLPAAGEVIGDALVQHPQVHVIAFTGSRSVGLQILHKAHEPQPDLAHVKQVVCEMGGKNAMIIDEDADLDDAVPQIIASAFGYGGQKCSAASRLIAVGAIHDRLVGRLQDALDSFPVGPTENPAHLFGPLITPAAVQKAHAYMDIGRQEGHLAYCKQVPDGGFFAPMAIFTGIQPRHRLAREEIFAPILAVLRATDFQEALAIAADSEYALTGGVFSRLPDHLALAREQYLVGNLYLNRRITGAQVGVQPFGGCKLSGTGTQAGGPDYLKQFLWSRVVSENTLRHGFVAEP